MNGRHLPVLVLLLVGLANLSPASAQVKEVEFEELQSYFKKNNDTLYVINFWATWCGPCVKELPYFDRLQREFADRPLSVLLVSLDFARNLEKKVVPFVKERQLKAKVLFLHQPRGHKWMEKISENWSGAIPATYIVKNNREVEGFYEKSFKDYQSLINVVKPHL
jgi:thiol-disulfide isomerase/thioredoxin